MTMSILARLLDGDRGHRLFSKVLAGNAYANLFSAHPAFQIEGDFGGTAGIAEMLLETHGGRLYCCPHCRMPGQAEACRVCEPAVASKSA